MTVQAGRMFMAEQLRGQSQEIRNQRKAQERSMQKILRQRQGLTFWTSLKATVVLKLAVEMQDKLVEGKV